MRIPLLSLALVLAACTTEEVESPATETPTVVPTPIPTPVPTPPEFATEEGTYETLFDGTDDQCGGSLAAGLTPANWMLEWSSDSTFEMVDITTCEVADDLSVECDLAVSEIPLGPQTTLFIDTARSGEIVDSETIFLELDNLFSCEGPDCEAFQEDVNAALPCHVIFDTTSVYLGN